MKLLAKTNLVIALLVIGFGYLFYVSQKHELVFARRKEEPVASAGMTQEEADQIAQKMAMMSSGLVAPSVEKMAEIEKMRVQLLQAGYVFASTGYNTAVAVKKRA